MLGFLVGAIAGGVAAYYWRDRIGSYVNDGMPAVRDRAAERLGEIGERADRVLDRAKSRIDTTIRTGQDRLRTAHETGHADGPTGVGQERTGTSPRSTGF